MKFSIITPAWNVAQWLPETIESVLSQKGNFEIEYIVVTDPSSDNTVEVAREYQNKVSSGTYPVQCNAVTMRVIENTGGNGAGMYAALNTGFASATGDIQAWIAGDDGYRPGAFESMRTVFAARPEVEWLKGLTDVVDENGKLVQQGTCKLYHRSWLRAGVYGMEAYHVEQDSVFWRASLWQKAGPFPPQFKSMGDYWRWTSFARYTRLWSMPAPISYFRKRAGQDTKINAARCKQQMWEARGNRRPLRAWIPRLFFYPYYHVVPRYWHPAMEFLYPFLFPWQSRTYIALKNGVPELRTMSSFVLR